MPSYIEDTSDVLRRISELNKKGPLPKGAIPVSLDITAMYPNIPHDEGIFALETSLDKRSDRTVPTDYIIKLMWLVLTLNTFEWKGKLFTQKTGTAIGTRSAPTFAGLFMGMLEKIMLEAWENRKPITIPKEWWRFIDDILFWWTGI